MQTSVHCPSFKCDYCISKVIVDELARSNNFNANMLFQLQRISSVTN